MCLCSNYSLPLRRREAPKVTKVVKIFYLRLHRQVGWMYDSSSHGEWRQPTRFVPFLCTNLCTILRTNWCVGQRIMSLFVYNDFRIPIFTSFSLFFPSEVARCGAEAAADARYALHLSIGHIFAQLLVCGARCRRQGGGWSVCSSLLEYNHSRDAHASISWFS